MRGPLIIHATCYPNPYLALTATLIVSLTLMGPCYLLENVILAMACSCGGLEERRRTGGRATIPLGGKQGGVAVNISCEESTLIPSPSTTTIPTSARFRRSVRAGAPILLRRARVPGLPSDALFARLLLARLAHQSAPQLSERDSNPAAGLPPHLMPQPQPVLTSVLRLPSLLCFLSQVYPS